MARLLAALLLAALLVVGQWSDAAAPSEAEEFWRTVLPNSPIPDAILMLLHPETNPVKNANDADGQGLSRKNPFSYVSPPVSFTTYTPFSYSPYGSHKHPSPRPRPPSSDDDNIGAVARTAFFQEEALQVGENLAFYFPQASAAPLGLLPRHVADSIPFSMSALAQLGIAADSVQAANMKQALEMCESPTLFCATSLEALVEAAMASLGTGDIRPVTSTLPLSGAPLQQYTIRAVRSVDGSSFVACHEQDYPYTLFVCHSTGPSRAYMVDIEGPRGDMAITVATVCHTDTSQWDPEHIAFKLLGSKPGGAPVCHILPNGHMLWAKNAIRTPAY